MIQLSYTLLHKQDFKFSTQHTHTKKEKLNFLDKELHIFGVSFT